MKCLIIANGEIRNYNFYKQIISSADYIICADGGAKHLIKMDICPNIIVGDLDSIDDNDKLFFKSKNIEFIKFPKNKDKSDTQLATDLALTLNPSEIMYIGVTGTRLDHTLANIALLKQLAEQKIVAKIINEHNEIQVIKDSIEITGNQGDIVSILALTEKVEGVTLTGFEYPLENASIVMGSSLGISNVLIDQKAIIKITTGMLLVIKARD